MNHLLNFRNILRLLIAAAVLIAALGAVNPASAAAESSAPLAAKPGTYTVQKGDTLYSIGRAFGVTVAELREANPTLGTILYAGSVLNIPARIQFAAGGTSSIVTGRVEANSKLYYLLYANAGQMLDVTMTGPSGATLAILGADGSTLKSASGTLTFRGVLPKSQDYILITGAGSSPVDFGLSASVPARIQFAAGGTSASVSGTIPGGVSQFYILRALKGQTLKVDAAPGDKVLLIVYGADGTVLKSGGSQGASFSGTLPTTQDYILQLQAGTSAQAYTMNVSIPATTPAPTPVPTPGDGSYTVQKGDTLYSIAVKFKTTVTVLLRANPEITDASKISVGQVIYLPGATIKLSNGKIVYVANSGDYMGRIATKFNVTLKALVAANPQISNPNLIYTGQRVNIP